MTDRIRNVNTVVSLVANAATIILAVVAYADRREAQVQRQAAEVDRRATRRMIQDFQRREAPKADADNRV